MNVDGSTVQSALLQLTGEAYTSAKSVLINTSSTTKTAVWTRLQQAFNGESSGPILVATQGAVPTSTVDSQQAAAWGYGFGNWSSQKGNGNTAKTTANTGEFVTGINATGIGCARFPFGTVIHLASVGNGSQCLICRFQRQTLV